VNVSRQGARSENEALRGLQVGVTEEKLDCRQIQPLRQPSASGFVSQIMPMQVGLCEPIAVHASTRSGSRGFDSVCHQDEGFPRRSDRALVLACRCAEHERLWAEEALTLQQLRQATLQSQPPPAVSITGGTQ
jgi:hypothetical protein